jgi:hypothetical protein
LLALVLINAFTVLVETLRILKRQIMFKNIFEIKEVNGEFGRIPWNFPLQHIDQIAVARFESQFQFVNGWRIQCESLNFSSIIGIRYDLDKFYYFFKINH